MQEMQCPVWSRVETKSEGRMYGLLLESVQYYVILDVGEDTWKTILEHAGFKNVVFATHDTYPDEMITSLAHSCYHITKTKDFNQWMTFFGTCFVEFCTHYGYDKLLRVTGRNYRDFLHGIDNIHEVIRFSYPRLQSPAFLVSAEDNKGCVMLYQSKRKGFKYYVIGQLQQVAKRFYDISVNINILEEDIVDNKTYVTLRLDFDNSAFKPKPVQKQDSWKPTFPSITGDTFLKVFPFCIVFSSQLMIRMVGNSMIALLNGDKLVGSSMREKFHIRRPLISCIWTDILQFRRVVFEVEYVGYHDTGDYDTHVIDHDNPERPVISHSRILLRGQMKYLQEWNMIAFLCTPLLCDIKDLYKAGLYINDLNLFDMSRDMVMAGWQHSSQLERSIEEQREKSMKISETMTKFEEWKQKSDSLLYNMIPQSVAGKLKSGHDPISTCEMFDNVTIMFNYIVGFGDVCSTATPMQIVKIINSVFNLFDHIIDNYDVFKVETLGDAVYMVAGGVPDRNPNHAVNVAGLALDLQDKAKYLTQSSLTEQSETEPSESEPWSKDYKLNTRIGMHTGSVVGGVVGRRMPQYCLFGDTVNTASRMQTYSQPGRIHISEPCKACLKGSNLVTIVRGTVNVKGKGEMRTFWLAGREGEESTRRFCDEIKQERNQNVRKYSSYDNAMDLHGMHASTSFAQMPACFGGTTIKSNRSASSLSSIKSNRSASSLSLSTLQRLDDEGANDEKTNNRLGNITSQISSDNRSDYNQTPAEFSEVFSSGTPMFPSTETEKSVCSEMTVSKCIANASDNVLTNSNIDLNIRTRSDNNIQTKHNIPKIVENDERMEHETTTDMVNMIEGKTHDLALGKFKLSLPKLSGLSMFNIPANVQHLYSAKSEAINIDIVPADESTPYEDESNIVNYYMAEETVERNSNYTFFLGSDEVLDSICSTDNQIQSDFDTIDEKVHFSISKSDSSLEDSNDDVVSDSVDEKATLSIPLSGNRPGDTIEDNLDNDIEKTPRFFRKVSSMGDNTKDDVLDTNTEIMQTLQNQNVHGTKGSVFYETNAQYTKGVRNQITKICKESAVVQKPPCQSTQSCEFVSDVSNSSETLKSQHNFPGDKCINSTKSESGDIAEIEGPLANGYSEINSRENKTIEQNISFHLKCRSNKFTERPNLERASCPVFSTVTNSECTENTGFNVQTMRNCSSDQECAIDCREKTSSFCFQPSIKAGKENIQKISLNLSEMCKTSNDTIHEHEAKLHKNASTFPREKLTQLEHKVNVVWTLNDTTEMACNRNVCGQHCDNHKTSSGAIHLNGQCSIGAEDICGQFNQVVSGLPNEDAKDS